VASVAIKNKKRAVVGPEFVLDSELVPAPEKRPKGAQAIYFPFEVLEVGRSFTTRRTLDTVRKAIRKFREEVGMGEREFVARGLEAGGCRAWRTK
jgi:hypothetical protein